ncbi:acyl-protein thioesterase 2 [Capsella rubella]|nr:acyl-protein thioesterase 2 [Capsella rubella]
MSYSRQSMASGSRNARGYEFGRTYVVRPKGKHQATLVWLHGLGDNGSSSSQLMESLRLPNIKWICPTAPSRPVTSLGGFTCTAWFDVGEISEDGHDDFEGLDASASHIANLLSAEPADVQVGIGGFSMGAAISLYSATCYALGRYGTGHAYPINLRAVVGLSGWLPGWKSLRGKIECSYEAARRAASLPIILTHGTSDDVVPYRFGEKSAQSLAMAGFRQAMFKPYEGLGHYTVPKEMDEVVHWLTTRLGLEGSR